MWNHKIHACGGQEIDTISHGLMRAQLLQNLFKPIMGIGVCCSFFFFFFLSYSYFENQSSKTQRENI